LGVRPPDLRHLTHGLKVAAVLATAGIVGASLVGLPATASGQTKSKAVRSKSAQKTASQASQKSTAPAPDYKSKIRKKDPPPNGGRPPKYQKDRPPANDRDKPVRRPKPKPEPRSKPEPVPQPDPPRPIRPHPPLPPPVIVPPPMYVEYEEVYQVDVGWSDEEWHRNAEVTSLIFASTSLAVNYAFISSGQINELAAGVGLFFGLTTLAAAASPESRYPVVEYVIGAASIAFSVWNLAGGMDTLHSNEGEGAYKDDPYLSTVPSSQTIGWTYSF
jgi:hypothetical protein